MKAGTIRAIFFLWVINVAVYFKWLSFSVFQYGDSRFFFAPQLKDLLSPSVWFQGVNFGYFNIMFWRFPVNYIYGLLGNIGLDSNIPDAFLIFLPIIILLPLGSFLLARKIIGNDVGGFIGSIVFCFNTYFLTIATQAHTLINVASAFSLFAILFFINAIESQKERYWYILSSLMIFLCTSYDLRVTYITLFVMFFYGIFYLFFIIGYRDKKLFLSKIYYSILFLLLPFALMNMYWFLPQINSGLVSNNIIVNRTLFGNDYWNFSDSIGLFHPFWSGAYINWFMVETMPPYFWLIPIIAFSGLFLSKKDKRIWFFAFISLLGIFLAKQVDIPFPDVYPWLFKNFPGFNAFRESTKFYFLIALGYSILIGYCVSWVWQNWSKTKLQIIGKWLFSFLVTLIFLLNTVPVITGEIGTYFVPRKIPNDYIALKDFLYNQKDYFQTLWIPALSRWGFYTNNHPIIYGAAVAEVQHWQNFAKPTSFISNKWSLRDSIVAIFNKSFTDQLLNENSVKYVIVPIEDLENDDAIFQYYGGNRDFYIKNLDKDPSLKKIDIGTKELVIYENENFLPYIYAVDGVYSFNDGEDMHLKYQYISKGSENNYFILEDKNSNLSDKFTRVVPNISYSDYQLLDEALMNSELGDCNAYDNNGKISKADSLESKELGGKSIELMAANHIACAQTPVKIEAGKNYLLEFDYESPNANSNAYNSYATYALIFNNQKKEFFSTNIPIKSPGWHHYSKIITVPNDATQAEIYIYARSLEDSRTWITTRYQNIKFTAMAEGGVNYKTVSFSDIYLSKPKNITYQIINPAKVLVTIDSASGPFFLTTVQQYSQSWKIYLNSIHSSAFGSLYPFAEPNFISQDNHIALNGYLDSWYIDVNSLCNNSNNCQRNSDGTYTIEIVMEYWPQRYFYLGFIIFVITISLCFIYLLVIFLKKITNSK